MKTYTKVRKSFSLLKLVIPGAYLRWRLLRQGRFVEALALLGNQLWPQDATQLWMCYRLRLDLTVSQHLGLAVSQRARVAAIISLAHVGRLDDAQRLLATFPYRRFGRKTRLELARATAPYFPDSLLHILGRGRPSALHVGLFMRLGRLTEAKTLLSALLEKSPDAPELLLLGVNLLAEDIDQKLECVNAFFGIFGLMPVVFRDASLPFSAMNLARSTNADAHGFDVVNGPLVSVLMTAFNVAERIVPAIESLLAQTWRNLEVIVVNDASADGTGAAVQALAARDARVHYVGLEKNVGTYVAKTLGLRHAKGEFVMCHDGDDWSHPERIARQMQPLLDDDALVATTSQWVRLTDDGQFVARQVYPLMRFNPSSPLFRRKVVEEKTGLWDCVRTGADSEFHARLKLVFGRKAVKRINLPLSVGAQRNDSLVGSVETGFGGDGFSPERLAYWEAWNYWHIAELRAGRTPCMPLIDSPERPFAVPASLRVDPAAIRAELSSETNGSDTGSGIARPE